MNVYFSTDIIDKMINEEPLENLINCIENFKTMVGNAIIEYSHNIISYRYIQQLLLDDNNKMAFYCFDNTFSIENSPCILVYNKQCNSKTMVITYYILMICTKRKFRRLGYASLLLDGFIERIRLLHNKNTNNLLYNTKIVLNSVEDSVLFYENYGFKWTRESLSQHKTIMKYEKYEDGKEYFIMEYTI